MEPGEVAVGVGVRTLYVVGLLGAAAWDLVWAFAALSYFRENGPPALLVLLGVIAVAIVAVAGVAVAHSVTGAIFGASRLLVFALAMVALVAAWALIVVIDVVGYPF